MSAPTHNDITDFISNQVEEEIVGWGGGEGGVGGTHQVVLKLGARKPKRECYFGPMVNS